MIFFTSQYFKHLSERDVSKKIQNGHHNWLCKITPKLSRTNIFVNTFVPKIWNRGIIMLVVRLIELDEKFETKYVLLSFKIFEKIKQVSSTKLTNWYKNISRWKTNKFFHRLIFLGANLKVSKILLQSLRASFRKAKKNLLSREKLEVQNTGT